MHQVNQDEFNTFLREELGYDQISSLHEAMKYINSRVIINEEDLYPEESTLYAVTPDFDIIGAQFAANGSRAQIEFQLCGDPVYFISKRPVVSTYYQVGPEYKDILEMVLQIRPGYFTMQKIPYEKGYLVSEQLDKILPNIGSLAHTCEGETYAIIYDDGVTIHQEWYTQEDLDNRRLVAFREGLKCTLPLTLVGMKKT
jgi:hypothetical protein